MKKFLAAFISLILICCGTVFATQSFGFADGGDGITLSLVSDITSSLTTNDVGKQFSVKPTVSNPSQIVLGDSQVALNYDTAVYEFIGLTPPNDSDIKDAVLTRNSDNGTVKNGYIEISLITTNDTISKANWNFGSCKFKIKKIPANETEGAISFNSDGVEILTEEGDPVESLNGLDTKYQPSFRAPSNLCVLQTLSVNGQSLTANGTTYTYNAPYSYNKLSNVTYTVSPNAKITFSPALNSNLTQQNTPVTITVTAEDNVTSATYTLNVNRAAAESVNNLTSLVLNNRGAQILTKSGADLSGNNMTFTLGAPVAYADRNELSLEFTKAGNYSTAQCFIDGTAKGNSSFSLGNLASGDHVVQVKVTAQSGDTNTYTINFTVTAADTTNKLSSLKIELLSGTPVNLTPDFSPEVLNYSATVPSGTQKVKVIANFDCTLSTVTGDGEQPVNDSIKVTVTAEDGSSNTYTIVVAEEKDVSGLQLIDTVAYGVEADGTEHVLDITNTSLDNYFKITIPYSLAKVTKFKISADWSDKSYDVQGINTAIEITENPFVHRVLFVKGGVEEKRITFDIIRETNEVTLAKLSYNGENVTLTDATDYSVKVEKDAKFITVVAEPTDKNAKVTLTSSGGEAAEEGLPLENGGDGWTLIVIKVESTAGNTGFYTLRVKKGGVVGVPWWVWMIIVILAILILILLIALIVKSKKSPPPPRTTRVQVTHVKPVGGSSYNDADIRRSIAEQEQRIKDLEDRDDGGFGDPFDFKQHR